MIRILFWSMMVCLGCKTSDLKSLSLRYNQSDYYYSKEQYSADGLRGYCRVWDRIDKRFRVFPYTYKVTERVTWEYYQFDDLIYLGRGYDCNKDSTIIKPGR